MADVPEGTRLLGRRGLPDARRGERRDAARASRGSSGWQFDRIAQLLAAPPFRLACVFLLGRGGGGRAGARLGGARPPRRRDRQLPALRRGGPPVKVTLEAKDAARVAAALAALLAGAAGGRGHPDGGRADRPTCCRARAPDGARAAGARDCYSSKRRSCRPSEGSRGRPWWPAPCRCPAASRRVAPSAGLARRRDDRHRPRVAEVLVDEDPALHASDERACHGILRTLSGQHSGKAAHEKADRSAAVLARSPPAPSKPRCRAPPQATRWSRSAAPSRADRSGSAEPSSRRSRGARSAAQDPITGRARVVGGRPARARS